MPKAARIGDTHSCPIHGTGVILDFPTHRVFIEKQPAAVMGSICLCPPVPPIPPVPVPSTVMKGSMSVFIGGRPAARVNDLAGHVGKITKGARKVNIGG